MQLANWYCWEGKFPKKQLHSRQPPPKIVKTLHQVQSCEMSERKTYHPYNSPNGVFPFIRFGCKLITKCLSLSEKLPSPENIFSCFGWWLGNGVCTVRNVISRPNKQTLMSNRNQSYKTYPLRSFHFSNSMSKLLWARKALSPIVFLANEASASTANTEKLEQLRLCCS